jgi:hypothetical protein
MWTIGETKHIRGIPITGKDGETYWKRINLYKIPMTFRTKTGEDEVCTVTMTKGRRCNFSWPDGAKEGSRDEMLFLTWFQGRFGNKLCLELQERLWKIAF